MAHKTGAMGRATYKANGKRADAQAADDLAADYLRWRIAHGYTTRSLCDAIAESLNAIYAVACWIEYNANFTPDAFLADFTARAQAELDAHQLGDVA